MLEISLNNITKNYGFGNILSGASLEIMSGERVAIVGRNGSGKTTILKLITGEETPTSGSINIRRGSLIGYLEQIPSLADTQDTTRHVLMQPFEELFAIENRMRQLEEKMASGDSTEKILRSYSHQQQLYETLGGYDIEENISRISTGFGLIEFLDRPFNALSSGQKTIAALARTILRQPDILLLDEPTNHLDIRTLEWFEGFLAKYKGAVVIVSHDRYFLDAVATKTILLEDGECSSFAGNYSFTLKERERLLMTEFEQYKNQQKTIEAMKEAIKRYRSWDENNNKFMRKARELEKRLEKMEILERPQLEKTKLPLNFSGSRTGKETIKLEDVTVSAGAMPLVENVNVTLFYKERTCLIGDNGTGKTTLIRAILGEIPPVHGVVRLAHGVKIGYIPQEIRFDDNRASMLAAFRAEHICTEGQARNILARYGFVGENVFKRVHALSGGEKVLLRLALLTQKEINLLILDEPTNHIDIDTREILEESLRGFKETILFVSHDRYFIRALATRILAIRNGTLCDFSCGYDDYQEKFKRTK